MADKRKSEGGIVKSTLYAGKGEIIEYADAAKATFHFKTFILKNGEQKEIDCSKKLGQPFELLIGKKFKLAVWEELLMTMKVGEISKFVVHTSLVDSYPFVAKSLRDYSVEKQCDHDHGHGNHHSGKHQHKDTHHCSMAAAFQGTGYDDLDELVKAPQDLIFEIHLLKYEKPGDYEKQTWQMDENEKLQVIPKYKEEGNCLYKAKKYEEAAMKYGEALGCLEQLCLREKPHDKEWNELNQMKLPFLLNYAQCKLLLGEYYEVIKHTTTVLDTIDANNVKALYRRAKARMECWEPDKAREDFEQVLKLDETLLKTVKKDLEELSRREKEQKNDYKKKLQGKGMFSG